MAQRIPDDKVTLDHVLRLVNQLTHDEQAQLAEALMQLLELRNELSIGVEQLERGEGVPADQVFTRLRARHSDLVRKKSTK